MAYTTRKGGDSMPLTITFHVFGYVFTIRVKREKPPLGKVTVFWSF